MKKYTYDFIVVGAGIIGACTAYFLRKRFPDSSVLLLDQAAAGTSTSLYSGGYFTADAENTFIQSIIANSFNLYHNVIFQDLKQDLFRPIRTLWCFDNDSQRKHFQESFTLPRKPSHMNNIAGIFKTTNDFLCLDLTTFHCSVHTLIKAMIKNLLQGSAFKCWESVSVVSTISNKDEVYVTLNDERIINAKKVIYCTGPWFLEKNLVCEKMTPLRRKKVTSLYLEYSTSIGDLAYLYYNPDVFFLPLYPEPRWLMSFTSREWDCSLDKNDLVISKGDLMQANHLIQQYCPQLQSTIGGGSVFCDIYTEDKIPIAGYVNNDKCQIYMTGMSGSGFRYAPGFVNYVIDRFI